MAGILLTQLTESTINGSGIFDKLMESIKVHLKEEYDSGRIVGKEYSNVYLSALQGTLQQAIAFILGKQTADKQAELLDAQRLVAIQDQLVRTNQASKLVSEKELLAEKLFTEQAQRKDTVDGASVLGIIGKQKSLYGAQTDGFSRDAEQKLLKIIIDTWNVRQTTDGAQTTSNGLSDVNIKGVVDQARLGIGLAISS